MDKTIFYYKGNSTHLVWDLEYLYGDKINHSPLSNFDPDYTNIFFVTGYSRNINDYLYSDEFIGDAAKIIHNKGTVLIDYCMESDTAIRPCMVYLLERIKESNLPLDKFILVYNNSFNLGIKEVEVREFKLKTLHFPHFMVDTHKHVYSYYRPDFNYYDSSIATKDFLMLNRRVGPDKMLVIDELVKRGWRDRTNMTFVDMRKNLAGMISQHPSWSKTLSKLGLTNPITKSLQLEEDVEYGTDLAWSDENLFNINPEWYFKSKVNIVVETWYKETIDGWDYFDSMIHHTEKTWKAIALGCPFVVSGTKGHMNRLKDFGMTVDTSYDYIPNHERYNAVLDRAEDYLSKYDLESTKKIALDNQKVYFDLDNHRKYVKSYFLDHIIQKQSLI